MADQLVVKSFRHINGAPARFVDLQIVNRGTNTVVEDLTTNSLGTVSLYLAPGQYDWLILGARIPFDVIDPGQPEPLPPHVHDQSTPAATWTVTHNRGSKPPIVLVLDADPSEPVFASLAYPDLNTITVELPSAETGKAYIP